MTQKTTNPDAYELTQDNENPAYGNKRKCSIPNRRLITTAVTIMFLLLTGIHESFAQNEKGRIAIPRYGVALNLMGALPSGIMLDYRATNRLFIEAGVGVGYSAGFRYFITNPSKHRFNVYSGISYTTLNFEEETDSLGNEMESMDVNGNSLYAPLGICYFGRRNFQYSVETGVLAGKSFISPWFGLRVGYRFPSESRSAELQTSPKTTKKHVVSGSLLGMTPLIGVTYERLLTPFLGVDIGIGLPSVGAGLRFYAPQIRDNKWSVHAGVSHHYFVFPWAGGWKTYFPLGLSRIAKSGLRTSFDLGPKLDWYENVGSQSELWFTANLRIGKAF